MMRQRDIKETSFWYLIISYIEELISYYWNKNLWMTNKTDFWQVKLY